MKIFNESAILLKEKSNVQLFFSDPEEYITDEAKDALVQHRYEDLWFTPFEDKTGLYLNANYYDSNDDYQSCTIAKFYFNTNTEEVITQL